MSPHRDRLLEFELGRPRADTLSGSRHANMKEMRFSAADGEWRLAFDPARNAVLLVAGDKSGGSLSLIARFPDRPPVELSGIAERESRD